MNCSSERESEAEIGPWCCISQCFCKLLIESMMSGGVSISSLAHESVYCVHEFGHWKGQEQDHGSLHVGILMWDSERYVTTGIFEQRPN